MKELYLETQNHPACSFKSVSVAGPDSIAPNSPVDIKVTGDFKLHGDHRGQALLDQALRHPGERVVGAAAGALAGVKHRQARRVVLVEQSAEFLAGHLVRLPFLVLHDQHAVAPVGPVGPVANEMENMEGLAA